MASDPPFTEEMACFSDEKLNEFAYAHRHDIATTMRQTNDIDERCVAWYEHKFGKDSETAREFKEFLLARRALTQALLGEACKCLGEVTRESWPGNLRAFRMVKMHALADYGEAYKEGKRRGLGV